MLKRDLADLLVRALAAARAAGVVPPGETPAPVIEVPRDPTHGDYASGLPLALARTARLAPLRIAEAIAAHLPAAGVLAGVEPAAPGFLNLRISPAWLRGNLARLLTAGEAYGRVSLGAGSPIRLDYPSFEEAQALDLGAARRAAVGEALAAILGRAGYHVSRGAGPDAAPVTTRGVSIAPAGPGPLPATLQDVVAAIGRDAARFFLVLRPADVALVLDLGLARRQTADNPAFYVQYTHARIAGLLRLVAREHPGLPADPAALAAADLERLVAPEELRLLLRLAGYPDELAGVVHTRDPARLARYALALAEAFHAAHAACPLLADDPALVGARMALAEGTRGVLRDLLEGLLSVTAPDTVEGALAG